MPDPYHADASTTVYAGDCLEVLPTLPDNSVDAVVTDPPYNLSFMSKPWDAYEGREDAGFAYWLAGLIDGEGHFAVKRHSRGTHAPMFALKMRADEEGTLRMIQRKLGVGSITREDREPNPTMRWAVQDKEGCKRLVDLLDKYPLRAKKQIDYWTWRDAVCEWIGRGKGNRWRGGMDNSRMAGLRDRLMTNRNYTDVPWSGHEFQDWCRLWAAECLRILRPGGYLLAFGGTRTAHRLACAIEDAGFEIRDSIAWLYGSGFPKSLDVSKAIDRQRKEDLEPVDTVRAWLNTRRLEAGYSHDAVNKHFGHASNGGGSSSAWMTNPTSRSLPTWDQWLVLKALFGFGDDMDAEVWRLNGRKGKPGDAWDLREVLGKGSAGLGGGSNGAAHEGGFKTEYDLTAPATEAARQWQGWGTSLKPAHEPIIVARKPLAGTVAGNVLQWGTGALNIDAARIGSNGGTKGAGAGPRGTIYDQRPQSPKSGLNGAFGERVPGLGRWPANVCLDEAQAAALDQMSGDTISLGGSRGAGGQHGAYSPISAQPDFAPGYGDSGGASRFMYTAKASTEERITHNGVSHPTVKPLDLMRWLVRLVCPLGGLILDPFAGSGTTVEAAILEGFRCIAIERGGPHGTPEHEYLPMITQRINRRRDPIAYITAAGEDLGLFGEVPA